MIESKLLRGSAYLVGTRAVAMASTLYDISHGTGYEGSPIAAAVLNHGTGAFLLFEGTMTAVMVSALFLLNHMGKKNIISSSWANFFKQTIHTVNTLDAFNDLDLAILPIFFH